MKSLSIDLAKIWGGLTTILSPRDMTPEQLTRWSKDFRKNNIKCLFDPQCYCPKSKLKKLSQYTYWDSNLNTKMQAEDSFVDNIIKSIKHYNDIANTTDFIIPNILQEYNEDWAKDWCSRSKMFIDSARKIIKNKPLYMTLSFPKGFLLQSENIIEPVLLSILEWDVQGFYIIAETPDKQYLVNNPIWLSNVFQICASIKLAGKKVIFGYGNHQLLSLSLMNIDALASGTWLNVRSFTNRFIDTDEQKRRSTWIYHPPALSEYTMAFMDAAYDDGYLDSMKPKNIVFLNDNIKKIYDKIIQPSLTGFNETDAFKHYLSCLKHQISLLNKSSYKEVLASNEVMLNTAEVEIARLEKGGIYAQTRSFRDILDINRSAIKRLDKSRGFALGMSWDEL